MMKPSAFTLVPQTTLLRDKLKITLTFIKVLTTKSLGISTVTVWLPSFGVIRNYVVRKTI